MMNGYGYGMGFGWGGGVIALVVAGLLIAALIKYLQK